MPKGILGHPAQQIEIAFGNVFCSFSHFNFILFSILSMAIIQIPFHHPNFKKYNKQKKIYTLHKNFGSWTLTGSSISSNSYAPLNLALLQRKHPVWAVVHDWRKVSQTNRSLLISINTNQQVRLVMCTSYTIPLDHRRSTLTPTLTTTDLEPPFTTPPRSTQSLHSQHHLDPPNQTRYFSSPARSRQHTYQKCPSGQSGTIHKVGAVHNWCSPELLKAVCGTQHLPGIVSRARHPAIPAPEDPHTHIPKLNSLVQLQTLHTSTAKSKTLLDNTGHMSAQTPWPNKTSARPHLTHRVPQHPLVPTATVIRKSNKIHTLLIRVVTAARYTGSLPAHQSLQHMGIAWFRLHLRRCLCSTRSLTGS